LHELEARVPSENTYPNLSPEFHHDVVRFVERNTLSTGDDFLRTALIATGPIPEYRASRMEYELLLSAVAKNNRKAETFLPQAWDFLLRTLGRPLRIDVWGETSGNPNSDGITLDATPKVIRDVLLHPDAARNAASVAVDNPEIQQIVDADQAVRSNWEKLSSEDLKTMGNRDHQRALRIREIVGAGGLHSARDFSNASLVLQHSSSFAGFQLAHELAVCSLLLGDRAMGRWLVAATYDRMLNSVGHDQRFGTQGALTLTTSAKPTVRETDESGICDAERLALGCPTLAAKRADFDTHKPTG
jgi:hypothetical protein